MASLTVNTSNRQAMLAANSQYAASRPAALGQLAMPPAKKYLIGTPQPAVSYSALLCDQSNTTLHQLTSGSV